MHVRNCSSLVPHPNFLRPESYRSAAIMDIEQWGFFSVPHLLWHGTSVYNGNLQGPVTLTPIAKRLAVELSLPVFTTNFCRGRNSNTQHSASEATALAHCATAAVTALAKLYVNPYKHISVNCILARSIKSGERGREVNLLNTCEILMFWWAVILTQIILQNLKR